MEKFTIGDKLTNVGLSNSEIIDALRRVSPEVFTDGKVDFQLLQDALGETVEDSEERYGLNWPGKRKSMLIARSGSFGTLRPDSHGGTEHESTKNMIIEGDNLEVLKLLQKSYAGKVKIIYIDPPYNTGNDFVYEDRFEQSVDNYLLLTGQIDEKGGKVSSNTETTGRYHSNWLNMMYPRLRLARNLLQQDGVIFVSIDDNEMARLRGVMDEIFGADCFIGQFIWKSRISEDTRAKTGFSQDHEYILCYRSSHLGRLRGIESDSSKFNNPDNDPRGMWRSADMTGLATIDKRPNLHYKITNADTKITYDCPPKGWRFESTTMQKKISEGRILWPKKAGGRPRQKLFLEELTTTMKNVTSVYLGTSTSKGTREVNELLGDGVFDFPKPTELLNFLITQGLNEEISEDFIIMDFFAGSGTTGHAVLNYNCTNNTNLRFILIQLPELIESDSMAAKLCHEIGRPTNLAEITKERMRRVGVKIKQENPDYEGDLGFKVFKLDSSSIKEWDGESENLQKSLEDYVNQIKDDRTSMDILYEVMLKSGIQLTVEIDEIEVGDNKVLSVDNCRLLACLDKEIKSEAVADIASTIRELKNANPDAECMVLFLDSAFVDSSGKLNMSETLKQNGFGNIRSI